MVHVDKYIIILVDVSVYLLQKWARAFRDREYHAVVDTNNGAEALNKSLKYSYLPKRRSMTLSAVAILLVEDFLPECRKTYLFNNYKQSNEYRTYKDIVPDYLQDRPRNVILHCLDRQATSMKFEEEDIEDVNLNNGEFKTIRNSRKERNVNFGYCSPNSMPSCSCPDWEKFHLPCKHFFAIFRLRPAWTWSRLPKNYLESAYLSLDNDALRDYYQEPLTACPETGGDYTISDDFTENHQDEIPHKKVTATLCTLCRTVGTCTCTRTSPFNLCNCL